MASNRVRRIGKELGDIQKDSQSGIMAQPASDGDLSHLKASFPGPPDTPYEGGTYIVDIRIPQDYPFKPPVMKFETKLWHPNVSSVTVSVTSRPCFTPLHGFINFVFLIGCYLSRYTGHGMVACVNHQIGSLIIAITSQHPRAQRPPRCRSRHDADE